MTTGRYRRRSVSSRARASGLKELHAIAGHLLRLQETQDLSEAQDRFLGVILLELEHRWRAAGWAERCRCRLCTPAPPMGGTRT